MSSFESECCRCCCCDLLDDGCLEGLLREVLLWIVYETVVHLRSLMKQKSKMRNRCEWVKALVRCDAGGKVVVDFD